MLKAEFHTHVQGDPCDTFIKYSVFDLIDNAAQKGFQVLAITCHDYLYPCFEAKKYARSKGIVLVSGTEMTLEGKHTLIYNITKEEARAVKTFPDLQRLKERNKKIFVIAPHLFHYAQNCLGNKVLQYFDLFDAWEYSYFHVKCFDPNKKTLRLARKLKKPLVGCSDVHTLQDLGKTYTLIDAQLSEKAIFKAIKAGKTTVATKPISSFYALMIVLGMFIRIIKKKFLKIYIP